MRRVGLPVAVCSILLLTLCTTAIIFSCNKKDAVKLQSSTVFNGEYAKDWYYSTFKKSAEWANSPQKGKKLPDWNKFSTGKLGNLDAIEFPLDEAIKEIPVIAAASYNEADKKRIAEASLSRILFIKEKNGHISVKEITYIPDLDFLRQNQADISHCSVLDPENKFTGMLEIKKWDGKGLKHGIFENGKLQRVGKPVTAAAQRTSETVCQTVQLCVWQQDCTITIVGDQIVDDVCGAWYNTGDCWDEEFCIEVDPCVVFGCDQGGGDAPDECGETDNQLEEFANSGNPTSENISIATLSSDMQSRTKEYHWKFFGVYAPIYANWEFFSNETGVQSYPNLTLSGWKFTSLTHNDIQISGQSLNWTVVCTRMNGTPTLFTTSLPGSPLVVSFAKMKLQYDMEYATDCGLIKLYKRRVNFNSEKVWNADE